MNIKIAKDFTFLAAIHFENRFMVNLYEMNAKMEVQTEDGRQQNVAIERMNYFLSNYIEDCIFVHDVEKDAIEKYTAAGLKVCTIPQEPFDQIVGMILLNKCNAIMEGRIILTDIVFGSKLSNLIKFDIEYEIAKLEYPGKYWYNDSALNVKNKGKKDKIISLFDHSD